MAWSSTLQLSEGCNVMLKMKGQVQRKKHTSLSELIKGAVLLGFTPSVPRTTLDIPVPQSVPSDEMTLTLQLVPAEVSALLSSCCLSSHTSSFLLVHFISFLIPTYSKTPNLSWPTVSAAAPTPAWDHRGAKSSALWSLMLVQVCQVLKWLIKHTNKPLLPSQLRQEHSHYLLYLTMWGFILSP